MLTLYQIARTWSIPNLNHFCVKLETYMRINNIPYRIIEMLPPKAPKGKLPYIEDKGHKLTDPRLIVNYLKKTYSDTDSVYLSLKQQNLSKKYQRLLEDHLYWISMVTRWDYNERNWQINTQAIFGVLPPVIRDLVASTYRKKIKAQIMRRGICRLSREEMFQLGREDIDRLADFIGGKPYFMGNHPTSLDASAYGILVNTLACPIESPLKDYALSKDKLIDFCRRMQSEFFPELAWPVH